MTFIALLSAGKVTIDFLFIFLYVFKIKRFCCDNRCLIDGTGKGGSGGIFSSLFFRLTCIHVGNKFRLGYFTF
ncbi:MAG TPA: hypothetical protein DCE74_07075 [Porphyromonadaceae bacterium]|nr:hypothetical protein [Porphyromonadaceae bacterium]